VESMILAMVAIFAISLIFSMFGRGGGEFYLPTIITVLAIPFYKAAGVSLFLILIQGLSMVTIYHAKHKLLDWKVALLLGSVVAGMAFLGGYSSYSIPPLYLKIIFASFLLFSAYFLFRGTELVNSQPGALGVWHREFAGSSYNINLIYVLPPVAFAALLAGMAGISGCGLIIPICILFGGVPVRIAMGTNTFLVLVSSSMSFFGHALKGGVDFRLALILGAMILLGSQIGSRLHARVRESLLRVGFAVILIVAAFWMVLKIFI